MNGTDITNRRISALAEAVRLRTEHRPDDPGEETRLLTEWQELMQRRFPEVFRQMVFHSLGPYGFYLVWHPDSSHHDGTSSGAEPVLLLAHYDVVPASPEGWTCDPWGGELRDGALWGRGTIDDKLSHVALLQAAEELLEQGVRPARPLYFAFGGDEERSGALGAGRLAAEFARQGLRFACTVDEGSAVVENMLPGVPGAIALIGCGEKGHINVRLSARGTGGHAATPPRETAVDALARALLAIGARRFPVRHSPTVVAFVKGLGAVMGGMTGLLLRAYPFSAPIVDRILSRNPQTDAMLRTTRATTMAQAGSAENMLPPAARANINIRLLPGEQVASLLRDLEERVPRQLRDRNGIELAVAPGGGEAPPESPHTGRWYRIMEEAIDCVWPGVPVLPYLVTATTDSRHYASISDRIYRFVPMQLTASDLTGVHGVDEHISTANIEGAVVFYRELLIRMGREEDSWGRA